MLIYIKLMPLYITKQNTKSRTRKFATGYPNHSESTKYYKITYYTNKVVNIYE